MTDPGLFVHDEDTPAEGTPADGAGAHGRPVEEVLAGLGVDPARGLSSAEAAARLAAHGPNRLRATPPPSALRILVDQFRSLVVLLLLAATVVSFFLGKRVEAVAIFAALVVNAAIGFFTELRARRSMEALRRLGRPTARVRRDGEAQEVPVEALVPGDLVLLEEGEVVPADLRIVESENLETNEAPLTGESLPAQKTEAALPAGLPLADRRNLAFAGTAVVRGAGEAVVVATGMDTELGRIVGLVASAEEELTPLERRLDSLARRLLWLVLLLGGGLVAVGISAGHPAGMMIETAIVLAIAAIPEGLPIVATLALARGMWRMARRNALVNRLSAVEALGATSVILSDKTGTLTENRMRVTRLALPGGDLEVRDGAALARDRRAEAILTVAALCENAAEAEAGEEARGDPTEAALLELAREAGRARPDLLARYPEVREEAFSNETRMMATVHQADGGFLVAVKGAPEAVIEACTRVAGPDGDEPLDAAGRRAWHERSRALGRRGLRVLGLAERRAAEEPARPYEGLTLLGLVGLHDPPRKDVAASIEECRRAGIRVVLLTGDQAATAESVARELGILTREHTAPVGDGVAGGVTEQHVFARVSPEQKLEIVRAYQQAGWVVGMTGDGVNDAPALKKADVGIAMGRRGTDAAREASDIVLEDDAFPTIVMAIEQGRIIFDNIRRFIVYLLSGNLAEILAVAAAAFVAAPLPLLPLQILFINLLFDVFPALALGIGEGGPEVMDRPPRPAHEPILTRRHWVLVGAFGVAIAASVLGVFAAALLILDRSPAEAVTLSFLTFGFARLTHVFNMRDAAASPLSNDVSRNRWLWAAVLGCAAVLGAAPYLPGLHTLLSLHPPDAVGWGLIAAGALLPLFAGQLLLWGVKLARGRRRG